MQLMLTEKANWRLALSACGLPSSLILTITLVYIHSISFPPCTFSLPSTFFVSLLGHRRRHGPPCPTRIQDDSLHAYTECALFVGQALSAVAQSGEKTKFVDRAPPHQIRRQGSRDRRVTPCQEQCFPPPRHARLLCTLGNDWPTVNCTTYERTACYHVWEPGLHGILLRSCQKIRSFPSQVANCHVSRSERPGRVLVVRGIRSFHGGVDWGTKIDWLVWPVEHLILYIISYKQSYKHA
jgi:hypothetical protein